MKHIALVLCMIIGFNLHAAPTLLEKGEPAPYTGILFTPEQELKLREINEEHSFLTKKVELLEAQNLILHDQVILFSEHSGNLSKQLASTHNRSFWQNALFFGLGMAVTLGAAYTLNQIGR